MPPAEMRAARANRVFCTDEKPSAQKTRLWLTPKAGLGVIQDRRLCTDTLFIRAQAAIRTDGFRPRSIAISQQ
jgi:hypothetical protein